MHDEDDDDDGDLYIVFLHDHSCNFCMSANTPFLTAMQRQQKGSVVYQHVQ